MNRLKVQHWIATLLTLFLISACGGGGSLERDNPGTTPPDPTASNKSVSMDIQDKQGNDTNQLSASTPLTVFATVTDENGEPVVDELVTFSLSEATLAQFNTDSSTALTDSSGVASIGLVVGQNSGDGLVIATVDTDVTGQVGFKSTGTAQTVARPFSLELYASGTQLASSGSDKIELTALVKNEQNVLLEGVEVQFSANENASLSIPQPITDANGEATAILSTPNDPENRIVTIKAEVSSSSVFLQQSLELPVVGTEINIDGPSSVIVNDSVPITIILEDSDSAGVSGQEVTLSVENSQGQDVSSQVLSTTVAMTASNGQVDVTFSSNQSDNFLITARALRASGTMPITVQRDQFVFVNPPDFNNPDDDIPLGTLQTLSIEWKKDNQPFSGGNVMFNISRGEIVSSDSMTNENGLAELTVRSDNAGLASITAFGVDSQNSEVSARLSVEFVATQASTITVDATPDSIGPDGQTSTISAVVRDQENNLVKNKVVLFNVQDVSNGDISTGRATTDRSGIATTIYRSNAVSTPDSVEITATVEDNPGVTGSTRLTVGDRAFDISIGTGPLIQDINQSTFGKEFSVFVTDPDSNPVVNANLTFSAEPVKNPNKSFKKGRWVWNPVEDIWEEKGGRIPDTQPAEYYDVTECESEDVNGNGLLDPGEDTNGDGQLTPGNVLVVPADATTDENGQAIITARYAKQFGNWVNVRIKVSGQSNGTESSESQTYGLQVSSADLKNEGAPPPSSPYGQYPGCDNTL